MNFTCPLTIYNVTTLNNKLYFNDGALRTITIPSSNYDYLTICTVIEDLMNASGTALTFAALYDQTTLKITITGSGAYTLVTGASTVYKIIGFQNVTTSSATTQLGSYAINLATPSYIMIAIDGFGTNMVSSN